MVIVPIGLSSSSASTSATWGVGVHSKREAEDGEGANIVSLFLLLIVLLLDDDSDDDDDTAVVVG